MACLMFTAGCAKADPAGVSVKTIASDIVFDAKAPEPDAVPTLALAPATDGSFADLSNNSNKKISVDVEPEPEPDPEPEPTAAPKVRPPVTAPPPPPKIECPEALATAFPREAATFDVPKGPKVGNYRWKRTISTPVPNNKSFITQTVFNNHQISNVSKVVETVNPQTPDKPTRTFTYDDEAFFSNGSTVTSYQVKDNAPQQSVPLQTGQAATTGAPDRGVAITKSIVRDPSGKQVGLAFTPSPPVLVLPLPVAVPTDFESVGVDPTGASLAIKGTVTGKDRVDACGDVVDGWRVTSTQTFTANDGRRQVSDVEYFVATQLGGIVILQKAIPAAAVRTANDPTVIDQLAQLDPSPLP